MEGVLSQVQDGQERVIAYYSKTPNKAGHDPPRTTSHSEDAGTFPYVSVLTRVLHTHGPL
jgi:hypothetical protein